jgi:hypothetical protein
MASMKGIGRTVLLALLVGCGHLTVENQTPPIIPANASGTYPLKMHLRTRGGEVDRETVRARVVVDGKSHGMVPAPDGESNYVYEYRIPGDRHALSYYFDVDYSLRRDGTVSHKNHKSPVQDLVLSNRYVLGLDSNRGAPGTRITVMGLGFGKDDEVVLGNMPAETFYLSPTTLQFVVPTLPANRNYAVGVLDDRGSIGGGKFYVDKAPLLVTPCSLDLTVGESMNITVTIQSPAGEEGVDVSVTTDIPDAIAMDDVHIFTNRTSGIATIDGISPGQGFLFLTAPGFREARVPLSVVDGKLAQ